jgi:hypothetical protein
MLTLQSVGTGARFSVPFFQGVSLDAEFDELNDLDGGGGVGRVPEEIKEMRRKIVARNGGRLDDVEFTFSGGNGAKTLGEATLKNRIKSHPDVGERWYPDILADIRAQQKREREEAERRKTVPPPLLQSGKPVEGSLGQAVEAH